MKQHTVDLTAVRLLVLQAKRHMEWLDGLARDTQRPYIARAYTDLRQTIGDIEAALGPGPTFEELRASVEEKNAAYHAAQGAHKVEVADAVE